MSKTPGGRILRDIYSVQFVKGRWVVGVGSAWRHTDKMTLFEARAEVDRRNAKLNRTTKPAS